MRDLSFSKLVSCEHHLSICFHNTVCSVDQEALEVDSSLLVIDQASLVVALLSETRTISRIVVLVASCDLERIEVKLLKLEISWQRSLKHRLVGYI